MIFLPLLVLEFMLFIGSTETSSESIKQLQNRPHCSVGDKNCVNDRAQRDATLTIIDYDNEHVVCDEDHPFFCDIIDPLDGSKHKFKKSSKVMPFDVHKQKNKRNYKSSQGNENIKSDGFVCAAYGFFPGMNVRSNRI